MLFRSDKWRIAECNSDLSIYYRSRGDLSKALSHARQGLATSVEINNLDRAAWLEGFTGSIYNDLGNFEKALEHGERGLAVADKIGDINSQEHIHRWLGDSYLGQGESDKALDHCQSSLLLAETIHPSHTVQSHSSLANVYVLRGERDLALDHLQKGLAEAEQIRLTREMWKYFEGFGQIHLEQGELDKAIELFQKALDAAQDANLTKGIIRAHLNLAEALLKRDYELAMKHGQEGMQLADRYGYRLWQGRAKCLLGQVYTEKQEWMKAEAHFKESVTILRNVGGRYQLGRTLSSYAKALEDQALATKRAIPSTVQEMIKEAILLLEESGAAHNLGGTEVL